VLPYQGLLHSCLKIAPEIQNEYEHRNRNLSYRKIKDYYT